MKTTHKQNILAAAIVGVLALCAATAAHAADKKPNILSSTSTTPASVIGAAMAVPTRWGRRRRTLTVLPPPV